MNKICTSCKLEKSLGEFYKAPGHKKYRLGVYSKCKECCKIKSRKEYKEDPSARKAIQKKYERNNPDARKNTLLKSAYGISLSDFQKMQIEQNNRCAICKSISRLDVDHCHSSGKVRGLLCGHCNRAIGLLRDSPTIAKNASKYLRKNENN
jgi:nitrate/TMAO reductase-like tetraheme cytochrome c subunit